MIKKTHRSSGSTFCKIFFILIIFSLLLSCSSRPKNPAEILLGQWTYIDNENGYDAFYYNIEFVSDGTFLIPDSPYLMVNTFEYGLLEGNRLRLTALGQSEIVGYELDGDQLKLIFEEGFNLYQRKGTIATIVKEEDQKNDPSSDEVIQNLFSGLTNKSDSIFFPEKNESFSTPEEAMVQFANYISHQEIEKAMNLFSINYQAERFDFLGYTEKLQSYTTTQMAPSEYDPFISINKAYAAFYASNQIKCFIYSLFLYPEIDFSSTILLKTIEQEDWDFISLLNPSRLKELKLIRTDLAVPDIQFSDRNQNNIKEAGKIFGYLNRSDYHALYEFEGKFYIGGFTLDEYEDGWQISTLYSSLAGGYNMILLRETTEADYLKTIQN